MAFPLKSNASYLTFDRREFPSLNEQNTANSSPYLSMANPEMDYKEAWKYIKKLCLQECELYRSEVKFDNDGITPEEPNHLCPEGHTMVTGEGETFFCAKCDDTEFYAANRLNKIEGEDVVRSRSIVDNNKRSFIYRVDEE